VPVRQRNTVTRATRIATDPTRQAPTSSFWRGFFGEGFAIVRTVFMVVLPRLWWYCRKPSEPVRSPGEEHDLDCGVGISVVVISKLVNPSRLAS
jgi:hypothetical protein